MIHAYQLENGEFAEASGRACLVLPEGDGRVWFHVTAPDAEERLALKDGLGLHELAIRDALRSKHPPKLEDYGDHLFVIAHTPCGSAPTATRKIAIFLGKSWVLSITLVPLDTVRQVVTRVVSEPERFLSAPERIAHALLDEQVLGFEGQVDALVDRVETFECGVGVRADPSCLRAIQEARREGARMLRLVRAQRDVMQALSRANHPALSQRITPYLRDVYDHCLRVHDHLESVRDSLAMARDGYLSAVNNRLSETMRVLTVIATIMMPLSLVAGVFGMNFARMPLLGDPWGFWATMGVMFGVGIGMLVWFRRRGWV